MPSWAANCCRSDLLSTHGAHHVTTQAEGTESSLVAAAYDRRNRGHAGAGLRVGFGGLGSRLTSQKLIDTMLASNPEPLPPGFRRAHGKGQCFSGNFRASGAAAGYPVTMVEGFQLPAIAPVSPVWYAMLRDAHSLLAWLLFATVLVHLAAALMHAWVRRDGVFSSMVRRPAP